MPYAILGEEPLSFEVVFPGQPVPGHRECRKAGSRGCRATWTKRYERWLQAAVPEVEALVWRTRDLFSWPAPLVQPIVLEVRFVFQRPQVRPTYTIGGVKHKPPAWSGGRNPHLGTVDLDNLLKGPMDALVKGGALNDDRQVTDVVCRKLYAAEGEAPHVQVLATHRPFPTGGTLL